MYTSTSLYYICTLRMRHEIFFTLSRQKHSPVRKIRAHATRWEATADTDSKISHVTLTRYMRYC